MTLAEFEALYAATLADAMRADPGAYMGTPEDAPRFAHTMTRCIVNGTANITGSPTLRKVARLVGIKHTVRDVTAFVRSLDTGP